MITFATSPATVRFSDFAAQADAAEVARMAAALAGLDLDDDAALEALRSAPWVPGMPICHGTPGTADARAFDPALVDRLGLRAIAAARARGAA